ncbi:MAG: 3-hydroxyacyl-CoA dehydrogenase NAD-binding domain-containing protein [Thermoguttaceae bacterium]|jgi:3-hydroxyacyl-CoA dehydrogenase/enoyl-CoA hydratase/3-hydroxybutyryl-CoA epimerase/3-hydroxyacyl-CoA dehydrogenase/enoyl-CoA hydratase/3-hydroxybutyryl-CoA epimerase/enoyl-CoA isomerase
MNCKSKNMFFFDNLHDLNTLNARALENVRAMVAWKRQDAGLADNSVDVRPIRSVGIIGAGTMGAEIAAAHIKHHLPVTIFDNNPAALATITERTSAELAAGGESGDVRASVDQLLRPAAELAEIAKCDLIIESILETLPAKQELLGRLRELLQAEAILASNTSTIPIGKLAEYVTSPERFCGLHFCHPVRERPLVEIVRGAKTGDETIAALVAHAKSIDKLPVVVADGPGFLVNRLLLPYLAEALELLMEGDSIEMIESAAVEFGMAKGPFRLMDEIGLDTTLQAGWSMAAAYPDRIPISPLLVALIKLGRLGQKSGAGFFSYADPPAADRPDPATIEIVARWVKTSHKRSAEDIILRLLLPMILEATRIIEDGEVRDPRDIDLGVIFGLGFPARRGGLLWWANTIKPAALLEMIRPLESTGQRWHPTRLLLEMAAQGGRFY